MSVPTKFSSWLRGDRVVPFTVEIVFSYIDGMECFLRDRDAFLVSSLVNYGVDGKTGFRGGGAEIVDSFVVTTQRLRLIPLTQVAPDVVSTTDPAFLRLVEDRFGWREGDHLRNFNRSFLTMRVARRSCSSGAGLTALSARVAASAA